MVARGDPEEAAEREWVERHSGRPSVSAPRESWATIVEPRPSPRGAGSSRYSRTIGRSCSSSKTSIGPTTRCWTSSTTCRLGDRRLARRLHGLPGAADQAGLGGGSVPTRLSRFHHCRTSDATIDLLTAPAPAETQSALSSGPAGPAYAEEFVRNVRAR